MRGLPLLLLGEFVMAKRAGQEPTAKVTEKPLQPGQCRSYMRKKLAEKFPEIVKGFVGQASKGSCPHVKLASELLENRGTAKKPAKRKGSAERMLEQLERGDRV